MQQDKLGVKEIEIEMIGENRLEAVAVRDEIARIKVGVEVKVE